MYHEDAIGGEAEIVVFMEEEFLAGSCLLCEKPYEDGKLQMDMVIHPQKGKLFVWICKCGFGNLMPEHEENCDCKKGGSNEV